jgi:hypothetical protein
LIDWGIPLNTWRIISGESYKGRERQLSAQQQSKRNLENEAHQDALLEN